MSWTTLQGHWGSGNIFKEQDLHRYILYDKTNPLVFTLKNYNLKLEIKILGRNRVDYTYLDDMKTADIIFLCIVDDNLQIVVK